MALSKELNKAMMELTTECSVLLGSSSSGNFDQVIVYLRRHDFEDGVYTTYKGMFRLVPLKDVILDRPINDFTLDGELYLSRKGVSIRPVSVKVRDNTYLKAALFARIRIDAQIVWVKAIVRKLNQQLELYKDDLRDSIAQEWCSQEHWRIFPAKRGTQYPVHYQDENLTTLQDIMKDLLPMGYDADWPMENE